MGNKWETFNLIELDERIVIPLLITSRSVSKMRKNIAILMNLGHYSTFFANCK
jgi:hypothetical protein